MGVAIDVAKLAIEIIGKDLTAIAAEEDLPLLAYVSSFHSLLLLYLTLAHEPPPRPIALYPFSCALSKPPTPFSSPPSHGGEREPW